MNRRYITEFLRWNFTARIATVDEFNHPHCVAVWYVYTNKHIYVGAEKSSKWSTQALTKKLACFLVDVDIVQNEIIDWRGVQAKCTVQKVSDLNYKKNILELLKKKYLNHGGYSGTTDDAFLELTPFRIRCWGSWEKYKGSKALPG